MTNGTDVSVNIVNNLRAAVHGSVMTFSTVSIKTIQSSTLPDAFELLSCFPNPARGFTTVNYALGKAMSIRLELYDISGKRIQTLYEGMRESGIHSARFDSGPLSSGTYYIRLISGSSSVTLSTVVVR